MNLLLVLLGALASFSFLVAQNSFTCGSSNNTVVKVNNKAKLTFNTQDGKKTPNSLDCEVTYEMNTCAKAKVICNFKMKGKGATCKGDRVDYTYNSKTTKLCAKKGKVKATVTKDFSLRVITDAKKPSKGGKCSIKCVKKATGSPTPTPAPTPAPTTGALTCDCNCGLAVRSTRIVGGELTDVNEYPWQAGLVSKGSNFVWCGGSLVNSRWVLGAAHCTIDAKASKIEVLLGEHDYNSDGETETLRMGVMTIKNHPDYDGQKYDYDFSMLKLKSEVDFCSYPHIRPICLPPDTSDNYAGDKAITTGWGTTSSGGSVSNELREVTLDVISNNKCKNNFAYSSSLITSQMLCANVDGGGKDACQGDSGGPLVTSKGGSGVTAGENYLLIGVVSWGYGCAQAEAPGVYARVTSQLTWIQDFLSQSGRSCPAS